MLRLTRTDISVWLVTLGLTVFADLTVAVEFGVILAALLLIERAASTTVVSEVTDDYIEDGRMHNLQDKDTLTYATIFRIRGPFLFGATDKNRGHYREAARPSAYRHHLAAQHDGRQ